MSHGNVLSLGTIFPADGQQALRRSCCTMGTGCTLVLALTPRTVPSGWGSALCNLPWGGQEHPELRLASQVSQWREGGHCKYV